jgi:hypothetical protein
MNEKGRREGRRERDPLETMPRNRIKRILREEVSSRDVLDIPYTLNMKEMELAAKKIIQGQEVLNRAALRNPELLGFIRTPKSSRRIRKAVSMRPKKNGWR